MSSRKDYLLEMKLKLRNYLIDLELNTILHWLRWLYPTWLKTN